MMLEPPPNSPSPAAFNLTRLAEQLVAHRLSRLGRAPQPGVPVATELLLDIFRNASGVLSLCSAIANRMPASGTLATVTNGLVEAVGARDCRLVFADRSAGFFVLRGDGSLGDEMRLPALSGIAAQVFADGVGRITGQVERAGEFAGRPALACGETERQILCVALRRHGGIVGVLQLFDPGEPGFTEADRRLAEATAAYIAELAARSGLLLCSDGGEPGSPFRLIERPPIADLSGRALILSKILAVAIDILDADRGAIFVYDAACGELLSRHTEGLGGHELRIAADLGLVGAAFYSGETVNVANAYNDPRFHPALDWHIGYRTRSVLCAPIFGNDGQRVGVVQLLNKRRGTFTAADERRLKALAAQMGLTIDYATLFEQTLSLKSYNESMLRSLSNGVVTVDLGRVVTFINQAASRILRLDGEVAVGGSIGNIFDGLNAWMALAVDEASADGVERLLPNSEFYIESEETWVAANLTLIPLRDGSQTPLGTMIVIEDLQREKELRRTMSRYLSNEVIDRLMVDPSGGLGGSSHQVTILFSDIRGFTALTERLGASETVSMLNEYFSFMEDVVTNRSGMIDKYIGDAIMALFGSPFPSANDAGNAVQAAMDMFQVLQLLNSRRLAENKAAIHIGVGVGTGNVITGNIGSPKRMDFTVIGDSVNLASRVEAATKTYRADILVCGTTWSRLTAAPRARRLDVVRLRGQSRPTDLWEILEHRPDVSSAAIDAYGDGLGAYLAAEWDRGLRSFEEAAAIRPGDAAAVLMAERCRRFLAHPPSQWDGVVDLD